MRVKFSPIIVFCLCFFLLSCHSNRNKESVLIDTEEERTCPDTLYFEHYDMVFLETTSECLISHISKIVQIEGKIFLLDKETDQIFLFSHEGKFIKCLFSKGRAPGECMNVMDFSLDKKSKELIVYADNPGKFMFFDYDGCFKREIGCERLFYAIASMPENCLAGINIFSREPDHYLSVLKYDSLHIRDEHKFPMEQHRICDIFAEGTLLLKGKSICFTKRYDNTIYRLTNGGIEDFLHIDFGKYNFPNELLSRKWGEAEFMEQVVLQKKAVYSIVNAKEIGNHVFFNTNNLGTCVVTLDRLQGDYWKYILNTELKLEHLNMLPVEDIENKAIGFSEGILSLKDKVKYTQAKQAPNWFKEKVNGALDTDNPVVFLYYYKN